MLFRSLLPEARGYLPLGGRVVLAARLQFGQMFVQGERGTPITRRFYLGGPGSHRGFGFNRLSYQVTSQRIEDQARDCNEKSDCPELLLPVGGDQLLLAQAELRVQLFRLFGQWVSAAAFFDAGDVAAPQCVTPSQDAAQIAHDCPRLPYLGAVDLRRLHLATGGGLRYKTVVGTLRFDLGVRLNRLDELEPDGVQNPDPGARFAYHISIGEAF